MTDNTPTSLFGLPEEVQYCKSCVMSNQRPSSAVEFNNVNRKEGLWLGEDGVCAACKYNELKWNGIDWEKRHQELLALTDRFRSKDGSFDVIVPGSGGKDSVYTSHVLKHRYGMHPLTVTWAPHMYTDIGRKNFQAWIKDMDNVLIHPNSDSHRRLTREAFLNLLHPFQPFILGQKQVGPKHAKMYGIKLIMYGESQGEGGSKVDPMQPLMDPKFYTVPESELNSLVIGGQPIARLMEMGFKRSDLQFYIPLSSESIRGSGIEVHHMGYYEHWKPQDKFYYAVENCGFQVNPERTEGTYSKYVSLDDKIDGFHYFTTFIKYGIGRASYDAAQEIRNRHITREEGVALVRKYDGEFPKRYFQEFLDYVDITEEQFWTTIDQFRSRHLWEKRAEGWHLKHRVAG